MTEPGQARLKPWDKLVDGRRDRRFRLSAHGSTFEVNLLVSGYGSRSGWYAVYPEGVFAVFIDERSRVIVAWNHKTAIMNDGITIKWDLSLGGRRFRILAANQDPVVLDVRYQTFRRYLKNPLLFFCDVFVPDDDWGLVADLPSYVHSAWERGDLASRLLELRNGEGREQGDGRFDDV